MAPFPQLFLTSEHLVNATLSKWVRLTLAKELVSWFDNENKSANRPSGCRSSLTVIPSYYYSSSYESSAANPHMVTQ